MGNIVVGVIVAIALFYCIRRMLNAFSGRSSCSCGCEGCSAAVPGKASCCDTLPRPEDSES